MEEAYSMGQVLGHLFLLVVLLLSGRGAFAQELKTAEEGRRIFIEKRCYSCHTINAEAKLIEKEKEAFAKTKGLELKPDEGNEGDEEDKGEEDKKTGGDLSHVGKEKEVKWIRDFIKSPKAYFKDTPECKRKGKKKDRKRFKGSDQELEVLVAYISGLKYKKEERKSESCLKE
jgi:hypothetical protein